MKGMKGRLLKRLKSIRPIGYLKQHRLVQVNADDGVADDFEVHSRRQMFCKESAEQRTLQELDFIDVSELTAVIKEGNEGNEDGISNKENVAPSMSRSKDNLEISEHGLGSEVSTFRRPDLNSGSLFDPNLLVAFQQAIKQEMKISEAERKAAARVKKENEIRLQKEEDDLQLLLREFEGKCPPGGRESVIFYTTSLGGIRRTVEDCNNIRFLLESFRVLFLERDVSMHSEFRDELWRIFDGKVIPPRLFIKGRYIGGAEDVLVLHEQGKLRPLFQGVPIRRSNGPCGGCAGIGFLICFKCSGSHKLIAHDGFSTKCLDCNENGLIICPLCC